MNDRRKSNKCPEEGCKGFLYSNGAGTIKCTDCNHEKVNKRKENDTPLLKDIHDIWC